MSNPVVPLRIAGSWHESEVRIRGLQPYDQKPGATVCECPAALLEQALDAAAEAAPAVAAMPARERASLLRHSALAVRANVETLARVMAAETGKPIADGRAEVLRSAETLELSAEEGLRIEGSQVPMDSSSIGAGKLGVTMRFPVGVVAAITPFNAPVNLTAHKLGPAWAAGNAVVLKPSPRSALTIHRFVETLLEGGIPADWLQLVQGDDAAERMTRAPQVDFVSFTGSSRIGERVKAGSGLKRIALELGGNGYTLVEEDAALEQAALACARNAMRLAGQSCISVQTVCVRRSIHDRFVARLVEHVRGLRLGDPLDPGTEVGPVISIDSAERIERIVADAVRAGAELACGGRRRGALFEPTVLVGVDPGCAAVVDEVFGPVVSVQAYDDIEDVFAQIAAGPFGLQAGIYTQSIPTAMRAFRALRMGAVIINGSSTWRSDQAPYGGVKASGFGREGPRYAIREMTEERFVVFNA